MVLFHKCPEIKKSPKITRIATATPSIAERFTSTCFDGHDTASSILENNFFLACPICCAIVRQFGDYTCCRVINDEPSST